MFQSCTPRNDAANDRFMVLMRMKDRDAADALFLNFNGRPFSSLEEVWREGGSEGGWEFPLGRREGRREGTLRVGRRGVMILVDGRCHRCARLW